MLTQHDKRLFIEQHIKYMYRLTPNRISTLVARYRARSNDSIDYIFADWMVYDPLFKYLVNNGVYEDANAA